MTRSISLLGSTGSIGRQTLDVAQQLGLRVCALAANRNVTRMEAQARKLHPKLAVLFDKTAAKDLRVRLADTDIRVASGESGLLEAAALPEADTVVTAVVGLVGLKPTLAAIQSGKRIALANKETLVCAGELIMQEAKRREAEIIPVDSEHSAIFQCLQGCSNRKEVRRLILTCSGGPFFGRSFTQLAGVRKAEALCHPNWKMGPKITVDCATLMNKGLEVIEAMRLYALPRSQVSVVIHRQSIIHSMVEFQDGAVLAQLGTPDMRLPIRYAFTYPNRGRNPAPPLDFLSCPSLTFATPDTSAFPCLQLAADAADEGGTACTVLNGANEAAVNLFLQEKIGFNEIPELVAKVRASIPVKQDPSLEEILAVDGLAKESVYANH